MEIKYQEFKMVQDNTPEPEAEEMRRYNRSLLSEGVKGVECLAKRYTTPGERLDYIVYAPLDSMLTNIEIYANGSKNIFVHNSRSKISGIITVRPLTKG